MKNIFTLFLIFGILCFTIFSSGFSFENEKGSVTIIASVQKEYPMGTKVIESGNSSFICFDIVNLKHIKNKISNIRGITLRFDNMSFERFVFENDIKIIKSEIIGKEEKDERNVGNDNITNCQQCKSTETEVVYGYSKKWNNHIFVDNKMCNVQIVKGEKLVVGIPAILDSF